MRDVFYPYTTNFRWAQFGSFWWPTEVATYRRLATWRDRLGLGYRPHERRTVEKKIDNGALYYVSDTR